MYILGGFFKTATTRWRHAMPLPCGLLRQIVFCLILLGLLALSTSVTAIDCSADTQYTIYPPLSDPLSPDPSDLYVLNLITISDAITTDRAQALWAGTSAALYAASYLGASGRTVRVLSPADPGSVTDIGDFVTAAMSCDYTVLAAVGPFSDARLALVQAAVAAAPEGSALRDLLLMGPYTGGTAAREWNPNTYFLRAEPLAEVAVLVRYLLVDLGFRRVGIMYLQGAEYGEEEGRRANELLTAAGRVAATIYGPRYSDNQGRPTALDPDTFSAFAASNPGAILILGVPGDHTREFIRACLTDSRTKQAVLLTTESIQYALASVVAEMQTAGTLTNPPPFFISGTNVPAAESAAFAHIAQFQLEMLTYLNSGESIYPATPADENPIFLTDTKLGETQVMGWVTGKILLQLLSEDSAVKSTAAFRSRAFRQARYVVGTDFVVGDFGGVCAGTAGGQGAACECNQGGRMTLIKAMNISGEIALTTATPFQYASNVCNSSAATLPRPLISSTILYMDNPAAVTMASQMSVGLSLFSSTSLGQISSLFTTNARLFHSTTSQAEQSLLENERMYYFDAFLGPLHAHVMPSSIIAVGPMMLDPTLHNASTNTIYVMPTLNQEIYIMYEYVHLLQRKGKIGPNDITVIVRTTREDEAKAIHTLVDRTAAAFNLTRPTFQVLDKTADASGYLCISGMTLLLGIAFSDAPVVYAFLEANPKAYITVDYTSYATTYDVLVGAFVASQSSSALTERFATTTSLPQWNKDTDAAHAESSLLKSFHEAIPAKASHTPRALETYIIVQLIASIGAIASLAGGQGGASVSSFTETFYRGSVYYVNDFRLGPYTDCSLASTKNCEDLNYGAGKVGVISMASIFDYSHGYELALMEPLMDYTVAQIPKSGITTPQIVGIAVGCAAFVIILIAAIVILYCCCFNDSRDNKNAPKNLEDPVTLVFTDIESSTAMWAACPTIMPDAVATHHKLIRQLIASYKCYEVKTIGDSFMIACKSPFAAVMVARGIQHKFLKHDWKTNAIDEAYRQFEINKAEEEEGYLVRSAYLSPEAYAKAWKGLRVRVGIHTGLSDIRQDEITKGYDYYGDTSNMAARTEAIANGGQVIMTGSTWWALSQQERDMFRCTNFGPQGLRGVPYGVEMYQLEVIETRVYGDLRTEIELEFDNEHTSDAGVTNRDMLVSLAGTMTRGASAVAAVLTSCFCVYPTRQRVKELQPLLIRWGISVPDRRGEQSDLDDYCRLLINLVALKIATVTEAQMLMPDMGGNNPFSAPSLTEDYPRPARGERSRRGSTDIPSLLPAHFQSISVEESDAVEVLPSTERHVSTSTPWEDTTLANGLALWRQSHGRARRSRRTSTNPAAFTEMEEMQENEVAPLNSTNAYAEHTATILETDPVFKRIPLNMLEEDDD